MYKSRRREKIYDNHHQLERSSTKNLLSRLLVVHLTSIYTFHVALKGESESEVNDGEIERD